MEGQEGGAETSECGHKECSYLGEKGENMTSHLSAVGRGLEWESGDLVHFGTMTRKRS